MIGRCVRGNPWTVIGTTVFGSVRGCGLQGMLMLNSCDWHFRAPCKAGLAKAVGDEGNVAKDSKNILKARAAVQKPAYALPEAVGLLKQVK